MTHGFLILGVLADGLAFEIISVRDEQYPRVFCVVFIDVDNTHIRKIFTIIQAQSSFVLTFV
jgi:hypothetical protein